MRGKHSPRLAPVAVLAATEPDLDALRRGLGFDASEHRRLFISRLYTAAGREPDVCLAGPLVGAPYAAMVAETLIAWGARTIVFIGWCGAVSPVRASAIWWSRPRPSSTRGRPRTMRPGLPPPARPSR